MHCFFSPISSRTRAFAVALSAFLLLSGAACQAATTGDQAGVFTSGSVSYLFRICSTCPQPTGVLDSQSDGAFGQHARQPDG